MSKISSIILGFRRRHRTRAPRWFSALPRRLRSEAGQATAEYGLVILAAAALAGVLLAWATGTGGVNRLMDAVMDSIIGDVTGR